MSVKRSPKAIKHDIKSASASGTFGTSSNTEVELTKFAFSVDARTDTNDSTAIRSADGDNTTGRNSDADRPTILIAGGASAGTVSYTFAWYYFNI